jgi:hypothetical protein
MTSAVQANREFRFDRSWDWICATNAGAVSLTTEVSKEGKLSWWDLPDLKMTAPTARFSHTLQNAYCLTTICVWVPDRTKGEDDLGNIYIQNEANAPPILTINRLGPFPKGTVCESGVPAEAILQISAIDGTSPDFNIYIRFPNYKACNEEAKHLNAFWDYDQYAQPSRMIAATCYLKHPEPDYVAPELPEEE